MNYCTFVLFILSLSRNILAVSIDHDLKGFDDSILFGLAWPGPDIKTLAEEREELKHPDIMRVTTANKEQYECRLPELKSQESNNIEVYDGPSPIALLSPLFSQKICSYRLESYWNYELCHGRYLRQYHEERDGKRVRTQEYFLGRWNKGQQEEAERSLLAAMEAKEKPKYTKIDGVNLPYLELVMDDGTMCDLSGKPRLVRARYVCYPHGKHEVYSLKETSTCEYEVLVLSPFLCSHPRYRPQETGENMINCVALGDSPKKPRSLLALEAESLKMQHQTVQVAINERDPKDVVAVLKVEKIEKDGETHLKFELHPLNDGDTLNDAGSRKSSDPKATVVKPLLPPPQRVTDNSAVQAFLNAENCLVGGSGWWKYEFCYGLTVEQYHVDRNGARTSVLLGKFDEQAHLDWIRDNPHKAPKPKGPQRTSISHFYSGGEVCDITGKPRQTEVKLKCPENSSSPSQVSLYLLEPRTCQYILGVESPLICDILPLADDNGLVYPEQSPPDHVVFSTAEESDPDTEEKTVVDDSNPLNLL